MQKSACLGGRGIVLTIAVVVHSTTNGRLLPYVLTSYSIISLIYEPLSRNLALSWPTSSFLGRSSSTGRTEHLSRKSLATNPKAAVPIYPDEDMWSLSNSYEIAPRLKTRGQLGWWPFFVSCTVFVHIPFWLQRGLTDPDGGLKTYRSLYTGHDRTSNRQGSFRWSSPNLNNYAMSSLMISIHSHSFVSQRQGLHMSKG